MVHVHSAANRRIKNSASLFRGELGGIGGVMNQSLVRFEQARAALAAAFSVAEVKQVRDQPEALRISFYRQLEFPTTTNRIPHFSGLT